MKLKIKTHWFMGAFPYHVILRDTGEKILELSDKNYKLARKLKDFLLKNEVLIK